MKTFIQNISASKVGTCDFKNNSTARIAIITISNPQYDDEKPYQIALDYDQLEDLINLMNNISEY